MAKYTHPGMSKMTDEDVFVEFDREETVRSHVDIVEDFLALISVVVFFVIASLFGNSKPQIWK